MLTVGSTALAAHPTNSTMWLRTMPIDRKDLFDKGLNAQHKNVVVLELHRSDEWAKVQLPAGSGWIKQKYLSLATGTTPAVPPATGSIAPGCDAIAKHPTNDSMALRTAPVELRELFDFGNDVQGKTVKVLDVHISDEWVCVHGPKAAGWIKRKYLQPVAAAAAAAAAASSTSPFQPGVRVIARHPTNATMALRSQPIDDGNKYFDWSRDAQGLECKIVQAPSGNCTPDTMLLVEVPSKAWAPGWIKTKYLTVVPGQQQQQQTNNGAAASSPSSPLQPGVRATARHPVNGDCWLRSQPVDLDKFFVPSEDAQDKEVDVLEAPSGTGGDAFVKVKVVDKGWVGYLKQKYLTVKQNNPDPNSPHGFTPPIYNNQKQPPPVSDKHSSNNNATVTQPIFIGTLSLPATFVPTKSCVDYILQDAGPLLPEVTQLKYIVSECEKIADARIAAAKSSGGKIPVLSKDEAVAVAAYSFDLVWQSANDGKDNFFRCLNELLVDRNSNAMPKLMGYFFYFFTALQKLPSIGGKTNPTAMRGITKGARPAVLEKYTPGATVHWSSFTSTARGNQAEMEKVAKQFAGGGGVLFHISVVAGHDISGYSQFPNEAECLLDCNSKFVVTGSDEDAASGYLTVKLQQLSGESLIR